MSLYNGTVTHAVLVHLASNALTNLQVLPGRAHSWEAGSGDWVTLDDFARVAHSDPYRALLGCESWQVGHSSRFMAPSLSLNIKP